MGLFDKDDSNGTSHVCTAPSLAETNTTPIVGNLTFYHLNMIISAAFTALTCILILILMGQHVAHLVAPNEQYRILRICFLIPAYSVLSFLSICFPQASTYLHPWQSFFEAVAMASFFLLMGEFVTPNQYERIQVHSQLRVSSSRRSAAPVDGLHWYKKRAIGVFQYPIVALVAAIATDLTQAIGIYCDNSSKPYFSALWIKIASTVSLVICFLSIIRYYKALKPHLQGHHVLLKLVAFKSIIGITLLETIILWILTSTNTLKASAELSYADVSVGIPSMLICIQVVFYACLFHYAYSASPYYVRNRQSPPTNYMSNPDSVSGNGYKPVHPDREYMGSGILNLRAWLAAVDVREALTTLPYMLAKRRTSKIQRPSNNVHLETLRPQEGGMY